MKVRYKEDPSTWRNSVLFVVAPLVVLTALLHWRHVISRQACLVCIVAMLFLGILSWARPTWFRGFYRASTWAGFWSSQLVARALLAGLFILIIVPAGILMRLAGKDPLKLKRSQNPTYWNAAKLGSSLDRLF